MIGTARRVARSIRLTAALLLVGLMGAAPAHAIVGGAAAPPGRWPWMVAVLDAHQPDATWAAFCGGVVIAARQVLTAGHCVEGAGTGQIDVLVGRTRLSEQDGRRLHVTAIRVFPGFVDKTQRGLDAAVLTLSRDAGVAPVALAGPADVASRAPGTPAWTMGWGRLNARPSPSKALYYADRLHELQVPMVGDDACEDRYGIGTAEIPYRPMWMLCSGSGDGRAACYGDSGGPLVVAGPDGWLDVGVVAAGDGCGVRGYYDLYARVDRIRAFALGADGAVMQPDPVAAPRVTGRLVAGGIVRCSRGRWRGRPAHFAFRWTRVGGPARRVLGAVATLRLSARDARSGVRCAVTASNRGGYARAASRAYVSAGAGSLLNRGSGVVSGAEASRAGAGAGSLRRSTR